jgi:hypothetical protein
LQGGMERRVLLVLHCIQVSSSPRSLILWLTDNKATYGLSRHDTRGLRKS